MRMEGIGVRVFLVAWITGLAATGGAAEPPELFVDEGACPFECCRYGEWKASRAISLVAAPNARDQVVAEVKPGEKVQALTGEVHTVPGKARVQKDESTFRKGDEIWIYTYLGEGEFKVWHDGGFTLALFDSGFSHLEDGDWYTIERKPESTWWVRIQTPSGAVGFTDDPWSFGGKDGCS